MASMNYKVNRMQNNQLLEGLEQGDLARLIDSVFSIDEFKSKMGDDAEGVMSDLASDVNIPFVLNWNPKKKELEMYAKTIMRKKNFSTPDKKFKELFLAGETIFLGGTVLADGGNGTLSVGPAPAAGEAVDSSLLKPLESFDSNRVIDTINDWIRGDDYTYDSTNPNPGLKDFFDSAYILERAKGVSIFEFNQELAAPGQTADNYIVDQFQATEYRSLKYLISLHETDNNKFYSSEVLFTHDDTDVYMTEYGVLQTDSDLGIIDANISAGNFH